ncbi:CheY-like chemotaxis protein [Rhizobium sp. PP-CC-3A-592]|nr:CheY-like chemotaxis protein [Rhizobium sp. PP-CC-3A-592]
MTAAFTDMSNYTILVVEDDYLAVADLLGRLSTMGVGIAGPAPTVEDALEVLRTGSRVSGAILDINLGGQMVFPLADELDRQSVPFLFLTGYSEDVVPMRHAGRPFLQKPFNNEAIASALKKLAATY